MDLKQIISSFGYKNLEGILKFFIGNNYKILLPYDISIVEHYVIYLNLFHSSLINFY